MLGVEDVQSLIDKSTKLFDDEHPFPLDPATVLYRSVRKAHSEQNKPFALSDWIHESIIKPLLEGRSLSPDERIFVLSGRAGQGKSTVLRHLFVHLCEQQDGIDPRIRPNFRTQFDADLSQFFKDFQDSAHYIQARKLSEHVEFQRNLSQLIFIDGLDEANEDYKIEAMAQLMIDNPSSIFLVSGRSRSNPEIGNLHKEEIIQLEKLQNQLQKKNCSVNLLQNSVYLEDLTHKEKKGLLSLIAQVDPKQAGKASTLHTLVENNSSILQRPADFLVYKAKNPKTKSEFFIEHLKWLVEREASKDDERRKLVKSLAFPRAFDLEHRDFAEKGRLVLSPELDDASIHALRLFNLVESTLVYNYLDLATPAARGLLLLSSSEIHQSREFFAGTNKYSVQEMVESFASSKVFEKMHENIFNQLIENHQTHTGGDIFRKSSVSILNGYANSEKILTILDRLHISNNSGNDEQFRKSVLQLIWIIDIYHPIDELVRKFCMEPLADIISKRLAEFLLIENERLCCQICNMNLVIQGQGSAAHAHCPVHSKREIEEINGEMLTFVQSGLNKKEYYKHTYYLNQNLHVHLQNAAASWFENRLIPIVSLFKRLAHYGPTGPQFIWKPAIGDLSRQFPIQENNPFEAFQNILYRMGVVYAGETNDTSYTTLADFLKKGQVDPVKFANEISRSRVFLTILYVLGLKERDTRRERRAKFDLFISSLIKDSFYPEDWAPDVLVKYDNEDLLFAHWDLMGENSQYANTIVSTFINKGMRSDLRYTNWAKNLFDDDYYISDQIGRSIKFLSMIEAKSRSPELTSIIQGLIVLQRISHLAPRNRTGFYYTSLSADIGQLMFNQQDEDDVLIEFIRRQKNLFPFIDSKTIPPNFIQQYTRKSNVPNNILIRQKSVLSETLHQKNFPVINLSDPIFSNDIARVKDWLHSLCSKEEYSAFIEFFAAVNGLLSSDSKLEVPSDQRKAIFEGLLKIIRSGAFFASLILCLRLPATDIFSILVECELSQDGYNSPKSSIIGNYAHRRILSPGILSHNPNNIDYFKELLKNYIEFLSADSDHTISQKMAVLSGSEHLIFVSPSVQDFEERNEIQTEALNDMRQLWLEIKEFIIESNLLPLLPTPKNDIIVPISAGFNPLYCDSIGDILKEIMSDSSTQKMKSLFISLDNVVHDDPTEKMKNRLLYKLHLETEERIVVKKKWLTKKEFVQKYEPSNLHEWEKWNDQLLERKVDGKRMNRRQFFRKYRPNVKKNWDLWKKAERVKTEYRLIDGEYLTNAQFEQLYPPSQNRGWAKWGEAGRTRTNTPRVRLRSPRRLIGDKYLTKWEFIKQYDPYNNNEQWSIWNSTEPEYLKRVDGRYHSNNVFLKPPKSNSIHKIDVEDDSITISDQEYKATILPLLLARKISDENLSKLSQKTRDFFDWLLTSKKNIKNQDVYNHISGGLERPLTTLNAHETTQSSTLVAWHTVPFFSFIDHSVPIDEEILIQENINPAAKNSFVGHLVQDELLLPGLSLPISWNEEEYAYSLFGNLLIPKHHSKTKHHQHTQGLFALTRDEKYQERLSNNYKDVSQSDVGLDTDYASVDLRSFPSGLRSLSRFFGEFENRIDEIDNSANVFLASSRFSSIKHRFVVTPLDSDIDSKRSLVDYSFLKKDGEIVGNWTSISQPWNRFNNPVYGKKFGIVECEDDEEECLEGFAEWKYLRFSSNKPRKVLTTFVESSDTYLDDPLFASPGWKGLFDEAINLPQQLEAVKANPDESKPGNRMSRVFGIITDTGMFDPFKLEQIQHSMNKVRVNLEQLRSGERVQAGRTNLLNLIRDITTSFSYSSWVGNSLEVYMDVKSDVLALLQDIESAEHEIMGLNLTGTLRDFEVIRAILDGLNAQHDEHMRRLLEQKEELEKQLLSNEVGINDFKTTVRKLAKHLDQAMLDEIKRHAVASFGPLLENRIETWCVPRKELSVRVLGMPQSSYPFSLTTTWAETLGSLQKDGPLNTKVGSLVRLDLKLNPKAGTLEPLITNIAYAKDELNSDGSLHENYVFLSESVSKWPEPLPHDTFFSIKTTNQDVKQRSNFMVPLHVKMERGYATHPNLNVEIPLFEPAQALADHDGGGSITSGELCDCTVDIRRDRGTGLFRYYVSAIQKRPN